jgi:hypothetical protein
MAGTPRRPESRLPAEEIRERARDAGPPQPHTPLTGASRASTPPRPPRPERRAGDDPTLPPGAR